MPVDVDRGRPGGGNGGDAVFVLFSVEKDSEGGSVSVGVAGVVGVSGLFFVDVGLFLSVCQNY